MSETHWFSSVLAQVCLAPVAFLWLSFALCPAVFVWIFFEEVWFPIQHVWGTSVALSHGKMLEWQQLLGLISTEKANMIIFYLWYMFLRLKDILYGQLTRSKFNWIARSNCHKQRIWTKILFCFLSHFSSALLLTLDEFYLPKQAY